MIAFLAASSQPSYAQSRVVGLLCERDGKSSALTINFSQNEVIANGQWRSPAMITDTQVQFVGGGGATLEIGYLDRATLALAHTAYEPSAGDHARFVAARDGTPTQRADYVKSVIAEPERKQVGERTVLQCKRAEAGI